MAITTVYHDIAIGDYNNLVLTLDRLIGNCYIGFNGHFMSINTRFQHVIIDNSELLANRNNILKLTIDEGGLFVYEFVKPMFYSDRNIDRNIERKIK